MYYIHKHEVGLQYGGPEEGGWWYEVGSPVEGWIPPRMLDEDIAYELCRFFNANEQARAEREEQYSYTSVLSYRSNHYAYSVEESPIMVAYPEHRPHYE